MKSSQIPSVVDKLAKQLGVRGFSMVGVFGVGGSSAVLKVEDRRGGRLAAKVGLDSSEGAFERFEREAALLALMEGQGAPELLDLIQLDDGHPVILMEGIDGVTLDSFLEAGVDVPEKLAVLRELADTLDRLHAHGWVHGDIKPTNVMVSVEGEVVLVDFGVAQPIGSPAPDELFITPRYVAPEQLLRLPADHRTDVYGLGILAFTSLAGPWPKVSSANIEETRTIEEVQKAFLDCLPKNGFTSPMLFRMAGIVAQSVAGNVGDRPGSTGELAKRLESALVLRAEKRKESAVDDRVMCAA